MRKYYCFTCGLGQKIKERLMAFTQSGRFGPCAKCHDTRELLTPQEYTDEMQKKEDNQRMQRVETI